MTDLALPLPSTGACFSAAVAEGPARSAAGTAVAAMLTEPTRRTSRRFQSASGLAGGRSLSISIAPVEALSAVRRETARESNHVGVPPLGDLGRQDRLKPGLQR